MANFWTWRFFLFWVVAYGGHLQEKSDQPALHSKAAFWTSHPPYIQAPIMPDMLFVSRFWLPPGRFEKPACPDCGQRLSERRLAAISYLHGFVC